jgi:type I restriction enzyme S subunit
MRHDERHASREDAAEKAQGFGAEGRGGMSVAPYPEYKDTISILLGAVPAHWSIIQMKRFAPLIYGDALPTTDRAIDGSVAVYGSNGPVGTHDTANTGAPVIIIGRKGSYGAVNWSPEPAFVIDTAYFIDEARARCDLRWLYWAYQAAGLNSFSQDTGVPGLARELVHEMIFVLPSMTEQSAIAAFLDQETGKIDALVAEQERLIALLKEKRQAVISQAVTKGLNPNAPMKDSGIEWLGQVPAHWETRKVSHLFCAGKGKNGQMLTKEFCAVNEGPYPVYSGQTEDEGVMGTWYEFEFDFGEIGVLFCTTVGARAMHLKQLYGRFSLSQNCMIVWPTDSRCITRFFFYHFQPLFQWERSLIPDHMQPSFRMEDLYSFLIGVPPITEQNAIVEFLDSETQKIDTLITEATQAITLLRERRAALISAAVTGKIDVRSLAPTKQEAA